MMLHYHYLVSTVHNAHTFHPVNLCLSDKPMLSTGKVGLSGTNIMDRDNESFLLIKSFYRIKLSLSVLRDR